MKILDDPRFILRLRSGDETAFRDFSKTFLEFCKKCSIKKYEFSVQDAEEIAQEVAMTIVAKLHQFDPDAGRFFSWAYKIFEHKCIDFLRKREKSLATVSQDDIHLDIPDRVDEPRISLPQNELSVIENLISDPFLVQAIIGLPSRYRQFLTLMLQEKTNEEIRGLMEIENNGALYTLKSRALGRLKKEYETLKAKSERPIIERTRQN